MFTLQNATTVTMTVIIRLGTHLCSSCTTCEGVEIPCDFPVQAWSLKVRVKEQVNGRPLLTVEWNDLEIKASPESSLQAPASNMDP